MTQKVSQVNDSVQLTTQVLFAGIDSIQLITQETSENIDSNRLMAQAENQLIRINLWSSRNTI